MKKVIIVLFILGCMLFAEENVFNGLIDNFEDSNITEAPNWWTFGNSEQEVVETGKFNKDPLYKYLGKYYMQITGKTKEYYIGGMGAYLAGDASNDTHLKLYVLGNGPDSGKLTIQLYDDDNGTTELEQDKANNYEPINDDRIEYSMNVTWKGWKVVLLPLPLNGQKSPFKDTNPKVGDNIWNPDHKAGSGGFLHFQFIFLATTKTGDINIGVDNIKLLNLKGGVGKNNEF